MVDAVVRSVVDQDTIRANMPGVIPALVLELSQCAQQYTGCVKTDELVFDECVEFVTTRFGWLNIMEIRSAFRLAAAGELGEVKLEAYFGTFTVAMLGKVLNAYKDYRERVVKEIREAEKAEQFSDAVILESKLAATDWDYTKWPERRLQKLLSIQDLSVEHCTAHDFDYFVKPLVGTIPEEEKKVDWKDAWTLAVGDIQTEAHLTKSLHLQDVLRKINIGEQSDALDNRRMVYYKRLLVKRWIESLKQSST